MRVSRMGVWLLALWWLTMAANHVQAAALNIQDMRLLTLLRRKQDVLAFNAAGLFRASLQDRIWKRVPLPAYIPPGGYFAARRDGVGSLFYAVNRWGTQLARKEAGSLAARQANTITGLYVSHDDGLTWRLVSHKDYTSLFLHRNGTLYAIGSSAARKGQYGVLQSKDEGKTWRDISGSLRNEFIEIFADPDHPDLVCVVNNCLRNYVNQAEDARYAWKTTTEMEWDLQHPTRRPFFAPYLYTGSYTMSYNATLRNYFQHDFGDSVWINGLNIAPERRAYTFPLHGDKIVRAAIRLKANNPESKWSQPTLIDLQNSQALWGVNVLGPDGRQTRVRPAVSELVAHAHDRTTARRQATELGGLSRVPMRAGRDYVRSIDLSILAAFSTPGIYKVQLNYDNMWLVPDSKKIWSGGFTGAVFSVTITP